MNGQNAVQSKKAHKKSTLALKSNQTGCKIAPLAFNKELEGKNL